MRFACVPVLAAALERALLAERYGVLVSGMVDHVVAKIGRYYFDADGAYTAAELKQKHDELESRWGSSLRKLPPQTPVPGISCPKEAVDDLVDDAL